MTKIKMKQTTIALPLPNTVKPQRVIVSDKNRSIIYAVVRSGKLSWHSTTKKYNVPKKAVYVFQASKWIGKSYDAAAFREKMTRKIRKVEVIRGRPRGTGRQPYGGQPRLARKRMSGDAKREARRQALLSHPLVEVFTSPRGKEITGRLMTIAIKQGREEKLTREEKAFLKEYL